MFKKYAYLSIFVVICLFLGWIYTLPDHYRKQGYDKAYAEQKEASDKLLAESTKKYAEKAIELINERQKYEQDKLQHEEKFNKYVDDVRSGRVGGLRIAKSSICTNPREETTRTAGNEDKESARLPREIEENLFRFADDRDQIILAFENFKQEVRIAKCFE